MNFSNYILLNFNFFLNNLNLNYLNIEIILFIITNIGLINFLVSFIIPKKFIFYYNIFFFLIQLIYFYIIKCILKINNLFLFGIKINFNNLPLKSFIDYGLYLNYINYNFFII